MLETYVNNVSVSSFQKYERCPYQWFLRYIEKQEDISGASAQLGKLGHLYIKAAIKAKMRPDLEAFDDLSVDIASGECPHLTDEENAEVSTLYQEYGMSNRAKLFEWVIYALQAVAKLKGRIELEQYFSFILPGIPVPFTMYVDLLNNDVLIDWKTGRNMEVTASHQLGIYAFGIGKTRKINPGQFHRKFVFTDTHKEYEDKKPIPDAILWAQNIYKAIENDLEGYSFIGKGAFVKKEGTACRWCAYKSQCFEEKLGPIELITVPEDDLCTYDEAERVAQSILLLEDKLKKAEKALEKYCQANDLIVESNGEFFGLYHGSTRREWDKLRIYEALHKLPVEELVTAFNIDMRGINILAGKHEQISLALQESVTEENGKPKFKHASKPPKAS